MATATKPKPIETQLANAVLISRDRIRPNPDQPREYFDPAKIAGLADSIRLHGIRQPLEVRYEPSRYDGTPYILISGERRYRASENVLELLPCIISNATPNEARQLALIENLQREDLTAMEEANGIQDLMVTQDLSGNQVAKVLGMSRGWVQNRLDLLRTGADVQAVAARAPYKMSSLLLIDGVKDKETRADLLKQVESGAVHSAIKTQIESYQESARQSKKSTHAPDTHTQQRQTAFESNGTPNYSRGLPVTGTKTSDGRQTIESALLRIETDCRTIRNFQGFVRATDKKRIRDIQKLLNEVVD